MQALWSVAFATATLARAGLLAYWAGLLALALPAMGALAASGRVSNIIGGVAGLRGSGWVVGEVSVGSAVREIMGRQGRGLGQQRARWTSSSVQEGRTLVLGGMLCRRGWV